MGRWLRVLEVMAVGALALSTAACDDDSKGGEEPCECPGGGACDVDGMCPDAGIEPPTCTDDGDCADGQLCDEGVCRAGCSDDTDCVAPEVCNPESQTCRNECAADDACPDGYGCVAGQCSFGACWLDGSTCADDQYCAEDTRTCTDGEPPPPEEGPCCIQNRCEVLTAEACEAEGGDPNDAATCDDNPCAQSCMDDTECPDGTYCTEGEKRCLPGCRQDDPDTCPEGQICGDDNTCVDFRCDTDDQCADGEYCLEERGTCESPCADDGACPDGYFCQDARCTNSCRDSEAEPNDDADGATPVALDGGMATAGDGRLCPLNPDWFEVTLVEPGERLQIELDCASGADLALALYDEAGNRVARSNDEGCAETITFPEAGDTDTGSFFVEVTGPAPADGLDYTLDITLLPPVDACTADAAEDDDVPADATRLLSGEDSTTVADRTACPADPDFFALPLGEGDGVRIDLTLLGNDAGMGDTLTFDLLPPGSPADADPNAPTALQPNLSAPDGDGNEVRSLVLAVGNQYVRDGSYLVRVRGQDAAQYGAYSLTATVTRSGVGCVPDDAEPNEDSGAATDLMAVEGFDDGGVLAAGVELTTDGYSRCADDQDWYRVVVAEGDRLTARLNVADAMGDPAPASGAIAVAIVDAAGTVSGFEGRDPGPEINAISAALPAGEVFVRVDGARVARAGAYSLTLIRTPGDAPCEDDRYDAAARNDEQGTASLLDVMHGEPLAVPGLSLCGANAGVGGDTDWYVFTTEGPGRLQVDLAFALGANGAGDLDLELFRDGAAGAVASDTELAAGARVVVADAPADTWYVRVSSFAGEDNAYDLTIDFTLAEACDADGAEPDDERGDATEAGAGYTAERWICRQPEDVDWYEVAVPPFTTYTFHLAYLRDGDGWITFDVYDADGGYVTTIEEALDAQCLIINPRPGGSRWFFAVQANTFRPDAEPDRVAYSVDVVAGDQCAALEPLLDQVDWPEL